MASSWIDFVGSVFWWTESMKNAWQEPKTQREWKQNEIEKKNSRCYALQTFKKVNFTKTVERVEVKKKTYAYVECCSFSSEHFNDEIFLLKKLLFFFFFFFVERRQQNVSALDPYHKSQRSEFYFK